jgi:hypothetical protein
MTSRTAYKKFKLRLNRLDTNFEQNILEDVFCEIFNKAQIKFINRLVDQEDNNKDNQTNLQVLLKDETLKGVNKGNLFLVDLPKDWFWVKRLSATDTVCGNTLNCLLVQESNVGRLLQNTNWKPSVEWEETIYTLGGDKLRIYTDNFNLKDCNIIYYKEPRKIDIKTGEDNIEGNPSQDIDPEFSDNIVEEILDLAVLIATSDIADEVNFSSKAQLLKV